MNCDAYLQESDLVECGCDVGNLPSRTVLELIDAASSWMYVQTGERYNGVCEVTEKPCGCGCGCGLASTQLIGYGASGGCCDGLCGCSAESKVSLSYGPILTASVSIEGVAFTDFEIFAPNLLVRTDGESWPSCQSYLEGWSVTYTYGIEPPTIVKLAAQDLVVELVKGCTGGECSLPSGAIQVTRRGVSFSLDPEQAGKALPRVALALSAFGRKGQTDLIIPGRRGLITTGPSGS